MPIHAIHVIQNAHFVLITFDINQHSTLTFVCAYFLAFQCRFESVKGILVDTYDFFLNLTTIPVGLVFLWDFELLKLKTCSLYDKKLFTVESRVLTRVTN